MHLTTTKHIAWVVNNNGRLDMHKTFHKYYSQMGFKVGGGGGNTSHVPFKSGYVIKTLNTILSSILIFTISLFFRQSHVDPCKSVCLSVNTGHTCCSFCDIVVTMLGQYGEKLIIFNWVRGIRKKRVTTKFYTHFLEASLFLDIGFDAYFGHL